MGRIEFSVTFVLNKEPTPTKFDLKSIVEGIGIKVTMPMSHGDPIVMEYEEPQKPAIKVPEEILIPNTKEEEPEPKEKPIEKKKMVHKHK